MNRYFFGKTAAYVSSPYSKELSCKKLEKSLEPFSRKMNNKPKKCQKWHLFVIIEWTRFFSGNPALWVTLYYRYLTCDQKLEKSLERLLVTWINGRTLSGWGSTKVENCNVLDARISPTNLLDLNSLNFLTS